MGMACCSTSCSPAHLVHAVEDDGGIAAHAFGAAPQWSGQNGGKLRRLLAADGACRSLVPGAACRLRAVDAGTPFDDIQVELEDALLAQDKLGNRHKRELGAFAEKGAARAEEDVLDKLLRDGGSAAKTAAFFIFFGGNLDLIPIETMVLVKTRIFCSDDGVLEVRRDLAQRNECVPLVIGLRLEP